MTIRILGFLLALALFSMGFASEEQNKRIEDLSVQMFAAQGEDKLLAVKALSAYNDKSLIPTFVLAMRWTGSNQFVAKALSELTGENITHWHEAYQWQERNPEVTPHETFESVKLRFLGNTDKRFIDVLSPFLKGSDATRIRLEEIVWGGVLFDGIVSLDNPPMIAANDADYLEASDLVFGVSINGDTRAYPLRIMGWHEMLNDVVGGVPVALAYCTLCGSGILFDTTVEGRQEPLVFGSSGLLYRSNKLMFDRETQSLWNQFTGEPVVGAMVNQGPSADSEFKLDTLPMTITTWEHWKQSNKDTTVLSLQTGYVRNYDSGVTYQEYFDSPDLMFPSVVRDESQVQRKDFVFGIQTLGASKAWPIRSFVNKSIINDQVGAQSIVLVGDADTRTVRAYERLNNEKFMATSDGQLSSDAGVWTVTEESLVTSDGQQRRARIAGHVSYWFAWENFTGVKSELYQP